MNLGEGVLSVLMGEFFSRLAWAGGRFENLIVICGIDILWAGEFVI
jgi:hypothetical protein